MNMPAARTSSPGVAGTPLAARFEAERLDWIVPQWPVPATVQAFFTTRNGGGGNDVRAPFDLGTPASASADPAARAIIAENRLYAQTFLPPSPVWLDQVHGAEVVIVNDHASRARDDRWPRADAAVTRAVDVALAVRVADCLPVLFSDRAGSVVGAAHAGWRGLAAGVLENAVAAMGCAPANVVAWLGPAIGAAAFEVGDDVRDAFVGSDAVAAAAFVRGRPGKWHADLDALARQRLAHAGVGAVTGGGVCTASDPARFFSFRRDRTTGRMGAFIWRNGT